MNLDIKTVHSNIAVRADCDWNENRPEADAMVTNTPGLILGILTADCTPVLFADNKNKVIGAAHAGWKGALSGVLQATFNQMLSLGAQLETTTVAIGPTIHQPSYEVTQPFKDKFLEHNEAYNKFIHSGCDDEHFQFNLPEFVKWQLRKTGLQSIYSSTTDTYTSQNHFSYRRTTHKNESDYGRQMSAITLPHP